jgi:hypothetical protein
VITKRPCPGDPCPHRQVGHAHVEYEDGQGQVVSLLDGAVIDPFDLAMGPRPGLIWGSFRSGGTRGSAASPACREASFGWVHVRPGCRCVRKERR